MWPWLIAGAMTVGAIIVDHVNASRMEDATSQMDSYIAMLEGQMSFGEFVSEVWPSFAFFAVLIVVCYIIATPRRVRR